MNNADDNTVDPELEALEEALDRGEPWKYPTKPGEPIDPAMPNPLVIRVTALTTGTVNGEEAQFLNGVDSRGKKWSRLLGSIPLRKPLIEGAIEKWDDDQQAFVETARVGAVRAGERVAIKFRGFRTLKSGPQKGKEVPDLKVDRPDALNPSEGDGGSRPSDDDDIPFQMPGRARHPVCAVCGHRHRPDRNCERPPMPEPLRRQVTPVGGLYRGGRSHRGRR